jgi:hypothetical protein
MRTITNKRPMNSPLRSAMSRYYASLLALGHSPSKAWAMVLKKLGAK